MIETSQASGDDILFLVVVQVDARARVTTEVCGDGIDNDGDGLIDADDLDCPQPVSPVIPAVLVPTPPAAPLAPPLATTVVRLAPLAPPVPRVAPAALPVVRGLARTGGFVATQVWIAVVLVGLGLVLTLPRRSGR